MAQSSPRTTHTHTQTQTHTHMARHALYVVFILIIAPPSWGWLSVVVARGGSCGVTCGSPVVKSELSRHRNATSLTLKFCIEVRSTRVFRIPENVRGVRDFWPRDATHNQGGPLIARSPQSLVNHSDASQLDPRRRLHAAGEAGHAPLKPFRRISRRTVAHLGCPT